MSGSKRELGLAGDDDLVLAAMVKERERLDVFYRARVDLNDDAGERFCASV